MIPTKALTVALIASCAASAAIAVADPAVAAPRRPTGCAPNDRRIVSHTSTFYRSTGSAAGKYNASPSTSTLSYSLALTKAQSTAWEAGATASVSFGIASVEAATSYTVTKTTTIDKTVTDTVSVPGHMYGYDQPKAEYYTFHVYDLVTEENCTNHVEKDYGYFDAIVAAPFFAECVATTSCTPKP